MGKTGHANVLAPQRETFARARASGATKTDAAREAGYARPHEAGSRLDKEPAVRARVALLTRAAKALAEQVSEQAPGQAEQALVVAASQADALPAVLDGADVLQISSRTVLQVGDRRRKVKRSWMEDPQSGKTVGTVEVTEEDVQDGSRALDRLQRHYDAADGAPATGSVQIQAVLVQLFQQAASSPRGSTAQPVSVREILGQVLGRNGNGNGHHG